MAQDKNLEIYLFIENRSLPHRPGWLINNVKGCTIRLIDNIIVKEKSQDTRTGYTIHGFRVIPYKLPILILKYKPDILLLCNSTQLLVSYPIKFFSNCKIGLLVEDTLHSVSGKPRTYSTLKSAIYRKADFFFPFSNDASEYLRSINVKKPIYRISWSIDLNHFLNADQTKAERIKHELKITDKLVFLTVSRIETAKGILNFLKAMKDLPPTVAKQIAYLIVGTGPQQPEIKSFLNIHNSLHVLLIGYKPYSEVVNYYYAADVFVLPTLKDLFSLTSMEAMACSLPILTTVYNGARELIENGINGYIFDSANIEDIRKTKIKIYRQQGKLKQMGDASLIKIKNYSHEKIMGELKAILNTL
ncbi:MAG: glycosyltransferase family 4 protein [Candidatus Hodarchaeota archaeon]